MIIKDQENDFLLAKAAEKEIKCKHIYDPAIGDPDSGVAAGTPFSELPDSWACPVCKASKSDFELLEG